MKKALLGIALILSSFTTFPQYISITPTYTPTSIDEWMSFYSTALKIREQQETNARRKTEAKNNALKAISEIKHYISDALGKNIDEPLRKQLNEDYSLLNELAKRIRKEGLTDALFEDLQWICDDIDDNIVEYNNRIAEANKKYEAAVREAESKPQEWSGTGFALKFGYIATNYHIVEDAKSITVSGINGDFTTSYNASVIATDKVNDVAIIKVSDNRFSGFGSLPYAIDMNQAEVGDDVFVLGYPLTQTMGDEIKLTNGIISSRTGFQGDVSLYQMSAPIQPGNSGGPMFNSKGNVVGIVCAHHKGTENVGYAIKTSYLKNLAESSSLSKIFPTNNTIASLPLSSQVKKMKKFVFIIKCSSQSINKNNSITISGDNKTIHFPSISTNSTKDLTIKSITLTKSYTAIEIHSKFTHYGWCNISADTYILANGKQYKLVRAEGINISPQVTYYNYKDVTFTLYFHPIPSTTTQIDLIEPGTSAWKLYGIKLQ